MDYNMISTGSQHEGRGLHLLGSLGKTYIVIEF